MSPMLLLTHPTGNANVRAAAGAFQSANLLQELHSCICWDPESTLARFLPTQVAAQLARRSFADVPLSMQHSHPWREVLHLLGPHLPRLRRHEIGPLSIDAVYRSFDRHVAARIPQLQGLHLADQVIVTSAYACSTGRHRHITSLPHHQILERMRQHDVLLFPTLFDGCGLVITEALSQGLPAARRRAQLGWL